MMNPYISFETALQILAIAHLTSLMILLAAANMAIAVIATLEEIGDCI